jgi:hypothetical protein
MTKNDTSIILKRIKVYFPKFYYDNSIVSHWYMELKDYEPELIIESLKEYSAGNSNDAPSVINLKSIADRLLNQLIPLEYKTYCSFCGRILDNEQLKTHEDRCRSIKYISKKYQELFGKNLDKRLFWELSKEEFDKKYDELLKVILNRPSNAEEEYYVQQYFESMEE